jgi:hypothetical protein
MSEQQPAPHMLQNRINIIRFLDAFDDESAEDVMSRMITFEADMAEITSNIVDHLASRKDPAKLLPQFESASVILATMAADDLLDANYNVIQAFKSGDRPTSSAAVLDWLNIAAQTRATNIAFFQVCELFGHALNGRPLSEDEDDMSS